MTSFGNPLGGALGITSSKPSAELRSKSTLYFGTGTELWRTDI